MHKIMALIRENNNFYYTVKPGDTLWSISKKFDVPIEKLQKYNNIKSTSVSSMKEVIVFKDIVLHEVTNYETLESICEKYNVTPEYLTELNGLHNQSIEPGQMLIVKF